MKTGLFITLEGVEGSGKSTLLPFIQDYLTKKGVDLVVTREPGGTEVGEKIREVLLNHYQGKMSENAELLLYFAGRAQHVDQEIKPALRKGTTVLCDRFTDSTYAYQGAGRGINKSKIKLLEDLVQESLQPDITIFLDVSPEIGLARIKNRGPLDRFEVESSDFFERVRNCYLERAKQYPNRYRIIDAGQDLEDVKKDLISLIDNEILPRI